MKKIQYVSNPNGPTLGFTDLPLIEKDGLFFKDMERTGELLPYEDWRLSPKERAADLASRLTVEEIAGLMLYSSHQCVPADPNGPFPATYNGGLLEDSGKDPWDLTDQQYQYLTQDHIRYILATNLLNGEITAKWNNELQSVSEEMPHAIPVNISSDPRHGAGSSETEFKTEAKATSKWPIGLGLAATFDPVTAERFGRVAAQEYRALGISTELGPQVDLGTEPRWMRIGDTFGQDTALVTDMGRAYCDGLQTDPEAENGWGQKSVAAMVKHWPGGSPCEGGRDAHYPFGEYAVYPGNNRTEHLKPFLNGAFRLNGPTGSASAVMPYYTVSWGSDPSGNNVGNSYSRYLIDLLRKTYGFEGVICTDWGITGDPEPNIDSFSQRSYGVEDLTVAERHLRIIENGVDQFGGNNESAPVLAAYRLGCEKHGEAVMRKRFEESAVRLLMNSFRCGLFENPYLDPEKSAEILGCEEFCREGFEAQLKSLVLLKNKDVLPLKDRIRVYVPDRHYKARKGFLRFMEEPKDFPGASREAVEKFYDWAETPEEADAALCFIESPLSDGYDDGYVPISLQYRPYKADTARAESIGRGDPREKDHPDRSYRGRTGTAANESDLDMVLDMRKRMGDKPVIVVIRMNKPCVLAELEEAADAILVDFGVQTEAVCTLLRGETEPQGLLPYALPKNMVTLENHCEDMAFDYEPYKDSQGHTYDFAYGLDFGGVIHDARTEKYGH